MDYKAIARAITDPENQPHQWSQGDLAQFFMSAADELERSQEEIELLHIRIDYYMKVLALLQQKGGE